jgi:hypothetical protein
MPDGTLFTFGRGNAEFAQSIQSGRQGGNAPCIYTIVVTDQDKGLV